MSKKTEKMIAHINSLLADLDPESLEANTNLLEIAVSIGPEGVNAITNALIVLSGNGSEDDADGDNSDDDGDEEAPAPSRRGRPAKDADDDDDGDTDNDDDDGDTDSDNDDDGDNDGDNDGDGFDYDGLNLKVLNAMTGAELTGLIEDLGVDPEDLEGLGRNKGQGAKAYKARLVQWMTTAYRDVVKPFSAKGAKAAAKEHMDPKEVKRFDFTGDDARDLWAVALAVTEFDPEIASDEEEEEAPRKKQGAAKPVGRRR